MRAVYKYPLALEAGTQQIVMPLGAKVVHVGIQSDRVTERVMVWAEVDPAEERTMLRRFRIVGTGDPVIPEGFEHRGTVFCGPFVFHVYEAP